MFENVLRQPMCTQSLRCVPLFVTPWTVARQASLSMGFPRQEYWSGLPFSSPKAAHGNGGFRGFLKITAFGLLV